MTWTPSRLLVVSVLALLYAVANPVVRQTAFATLELRQTAPLAPRVPLSYVIAEPETPPTATGTDERDVCARHREDFRLVSSVEATHRVHEMSVGNRELSNLTRARRRHVKRVDAGGKIQQLAVIIINKNALNTGVT